MWFKRQASQAVATMVLGLSSFAFGAGSVVHVDDDAPPGGDGTSWDTAYRFLQDAMIDAGGGGIVEIRIGQGTYTPDRDEANPDGTGERFATFELLNGVALMGGYAGIGAKNPDDRDVELYETILTGDLLGDDEPDFVNNDENSYNVVTSSGTDDSAVLNGVTITAGNANGDDFEQRIGGGIINLGGNPTILNCRFNNNNAVGGGVMFNTGNPTISKCLFSNNKANNAGAIWNDGSAIPLITDCVFTANVASNAAGAVVSISASNAIFINCLFVGNTASGNGGAMLIECASFPTITNCTFVSNTAGGGNGGGAIVSLTPPTLTNCILWNNVPSQITGVAAVSYCLVQGGWPGTGNIDADPLFVDPDNDDYHLSPGSPSIDAGNNWGVPIDENDYDEDGVLCELFPVDLDGNPRFNADEADFDPGCGVPVVVDMGAYEYQFDPVDQVTFADLNADGTVGGADLLGLLVSWGKCGKGCCLADLDLDGSVGASDLLTLLANWGPCP